MKIKKKKNKVNKNIEKRRKIKKRRKKIDKKVEELLKSISDYVNLKEKKGEKIK